MSIGSGAVAVCWICLEGGADEKGKPIVRDCACRGDDAGFAHTTCIIKNAQQKSDQVIAMSESFITPWLKCPICHQDYQNDLAIELAEASVSFAERTCGYPGNRLEDKMKIMEALRHHIQSYRGGSDSNRHKEDNRIHKLLKMVDQAKEEHDMDGWVHMPPTNEEFQKYSHICSNFEAYGYYCLAQHYQSDQSAEGMKSEIEYYEKARDIFLSVGCAPLASRMTFNVNRARAKSSGDHTGYVANLKKMYDDSLAVCGESAESTIMSGIQYSLWLRQSHCSIEAERLATKLAAISHQVYGEEHKLHTKCNDLLNKCKRRFVHMVTPESCYDSILAHRYEAIGYENDGEDCIISNSGPIISKLSLPDEDKDKDKDGQTCHISSKLIIPAIGCPVICHGLINAPHLNGKLGDARSGKFGNGSIGDLRLVVYFEDKSLNPVAVKPGNLRIAFVLPSV